MEGNMDNADVDRILREIHVVQACVHGIARTIEGNTLPDEATYQEAIRDLADYHLIREWLKDAGLSTYEISVAQENTVAGSIVLNAIIEGIKTGLMLTVRVVREESDIAVEAVQGWLAAEEMLKDSAAMKRFEEKPLADRMYATYNERAKMMIARAEAIEADDSADANAETMATEAAFLRGRACEAGNMADLVLKTLKVSEGDSPKK
jgi:hypothetical protein